MKIILLTIDMPSADDRDYKVVTTKYSKEEIEAEIEKCVKEQGNEYLPVYPYEVIEYLEDRGIINDLSNIEELWFDLDVDIDEIEGSMD